MWQFSDGIVLETGPPQTGSAFGRQSLGPKGCASGGAEALLTLRIIISILIIANTIIIIIAIISITIISIMTIISIITIMPAAPKRPLRAKDSDGQPDTAGARNVFSILCCLFQVYFSLF